MTGANSASPDQGPLRLTVPEPAFRPGDTPDFSDVAVPVAGQVYRPDPGASAEEMRDFAFDIVRVLDDEGRAHGEWAEASPLSWDDLRTGLRHMVTLRVFDQRMMLAQRQQKTSFYIQNLGEEAVACAFQRALSPGDMNFPTYRQAGLLIAAGYPLVNMMNQIFANAGDSAHGRQLPTLYSSKEFGYFTISGNVATQYPQAVGWAMASAIAGDTKIAVGWIGDGSTAESDFHAALVFASTYQAPVVLNVVNNQWAISTFSGIAKGSAATFAARGSGFGIPSIRVDGNDYLAVHAVARWAVERARSNRGPTMIEHVTYRAGGHSTSDDPTAYRAVGEANVWPLGDPVERLKQHLIRHDQWSDEQHRGLVEQVSAEVAAAQAEAEAIGTLHSGRRSSRRIMFEGVFETMPPHLARQREEAGY